MTPNENLFKNATPREKLYKIAAGNGLFLFISATGAKYWRGRYWVEGKERSYSLGHYPKWRFTPARQEWDLIKLRIKTEGYDPSLEKRVEKAEALVQVGTLFCDIAEDYISYREADLSPATTKRNRCVLERHIYPVMKNIPADRVSVPMVVQLARGVERELPETASRVLVLIEQIFRHANHGGTVTNNPGRDAKGCLRPNRQKVHFPAITDDLNRLGEFLVGVADWRRSVGMETILRITWHLGQRPHDVRHMRWSELDLDAAEPVWTFSVQKSRAMSPGDKVQKLPLTDYVMRQLKRLRKVTGDQHVFLFPSQRGMDRPISDAAVGQVIKELGFRGEMTAHGARAILRSLGEEQLHFSPYILERILSHHTAKDNLRGAYARSSLLEAKREFLEAWSEFLLKLEDETRKRLAGDNVVQMERVSGR